MKIAIKIASIPKKNRIRDLSKMHKVAVSLGVNDNMRSHQLEIRPLKETAYNKLKNQLDPLPLKALVAIAAGESLPRGSKLVHLESVIKHLISELGCLG